SLKAMKILRSSAIASSLALKVISRAAMLSSAAHASIISTISVLLFRTTTAPLRRTEITKPSRSSAASASRIGVRLVPQLLSNLTFINPARLLGTIDITLSIYLLLPPLLRVAKIRNANYEQAVSISHLLVVTQRIRNRNGSAGQGLTAGSSGKSRGKSLLACDRKVIDRTSCIVPSENPIRWIRLIGQNHRILKSDVRGLGQVSCVLRLQRLMPSFIAVPS